MGNCRYCKYWEAPYADTYGNDGRCERIVPAYSFSDGRWQAYEGVPALIAADDGRGALITKPDFGCMLYEIHPDKVATDEEIRQQLQETGDRLSNYIRK